MNFAESYGIWNVRQLFSAYRVGKMSDYHIVGWKFDEDI